MQRNRDFATIGIITANTQDEHTSSLLKELCTSFHQNHYRVQIFTHLSTLQYVDDSDMGEMKFERLIPYDQLSALILISNTITNDQYLESIRSHAAKEKVPVFSLLRQLDGCFNIIYDSRSAMDELLTHVIREHHAKKINLIAGSDLLPVTHMMLDRFHTVLPEQGLTVDEERISLNNTDTHTVRKSVKNFLSSSLPLPDAIICMDNNAARIVVEELQEHFLMVPEDVIVTGFGSAFGESVSPYHFTSTSYPLQEMIEIILEIIEEQFLNTDFTILEDLIEITATPVFAHSCGCEPLTTDILNEQMLGTLRILEQERSYRQSVTQLQIAIQKEPSIETLANEFEAFLENIDIQTAFLCLHPFFTGESDMEAWNDTPEQLLLLCSCIDGHYTKEHLLFSTKELLPSDHLHPENYGQLAFIPLHIQEHFYGYLALSFDDATPIRCILDLITLINSLLGTIQNQINFVKLNRQLREVSEQTVLSLSEIIEEKSEVTGLHVKRVSEYSRVLATQLGLPQSEVDTIRIAAMMHDIGKINIPPEILDKPGKLTQEEFLLIQSHVTDGNRMLRNAPGKIMQMAARIALEHHEKWNGKGYLHWKGETIHIESRIVALADVFDALVSRRPYKEPYTPQKAYEIILNDRGEHFDPQVVDAFVDCFDEILQIWEKYPDEEDEFDF